MLAAFESWFDCSVDGRAVVRGFYVRGWWGDGGCDGMGWIENSGFGMDVEVGVVGFYISFG